jgi:hypothetical protein
MKTRTKMGQKKSTSATVGTPEISQENLFTISGEERNFSKIETPKSSKPENDNSSVTGAIRKSIAWYESDDGKIVWERMRETSKDALRDFLKKPEVWDGLKIEKPTLTAQGTPSTKPLVSGEVISRAYDFLGKFESFLFQRATKCSDEIASKVWVFDDEEKAALIPATAAILAKHGPEWLSGFDVEIEFCVIFFSLQMSKFMTMKTLLERERKNGKGNRPPVIPISQPMFVPEVPVPEEPELHSGNISKNAAEKSARDTGSADVESLEERDAGNPPPPIQ